MDKGIEQLLDEVKKELDGLNQVIDIYNSVSAGVENQDVQSGLTYLLERKNDLEQKQREYEIELHGIAPESEGDDWWNMDWRNLDFEDIELTDAEKWEAIKAAEYNMKAFELTKINDKPACFEREVESQIVYKKMLKYVQKKKAEQTEPEKEMGEVETTMASDNAVCQKEIQENDVVQADKTEFENKKIREKIMMNIRNDARIHEVELTENEKAEARKMAENIINMFGGGFVSDRRYRDECDRQIYLMKMTKYMEMNKNTCNNTEHAEVQEEVGDIVTVVANDDTVCQEEVQEKEMGQTDKTECDSEAMQVREQESNNGEGNLEKKARFVTIRRNPEIDKVELTEEEEEDARCIAERIVSLFCTPSKYGTASRFADEFERQKSLKRMFKYSDMKKAELNNAEIPQQEDADNVSNVVDNKSWLNQTEAQKDEYLVCLDKLSQEGELNLEKDEYQLYLDGLTRESQEVKRVECVAVQSDAELIKEKFLARKRDSEVVEDINAVGRM